MSQNDFLISYRATPREDVSPKITLPKNTFVNPTRQSLQRTKGYVSHMNDKNFFCSVRMKILTVYFDLKSYMFRWLRIRSVLWHTFLIFRNNYRKSVSNKKTVKCLNICWFSCLFLKFCIPKLYATHCSDALIFNSGSFGAL